MRNVDINSVLLEGLMVSEVERFGCNAVFVVTSRHGNIYATMPIVIEPGKLADKALETLKSCMRVRVVGEIETYDGVNVIKADHIEYRKKDIMEEDDV